MQCVRPGLVREAQPACRCARAGGNAGADRKSTRLNSSHSQISYAVFCLKKQNHIGLGARDYAVRLYKHGNITLNEAADLAIATPMEMIDILLDHRIRVNVTLDEHAKPLE